MSHDTYTYYTARIQNHCSTAQLVLNVMGLKYFQVVAGMNFFVKVSLGDGKHVHIRSQVKRIYFPFEIEIKMNAYHSRIYRDLSQNVTLHSLQEGKTEADPLEHF